MRAQFQIRCRAVADCQNGQACVVSRTHVDGTRKSRRQERNGPQQNSQPRSTRLMQSQLFEVAAFDPAAFAAAAAISLVIGVAAAYVPARSAARVDPVALLRAE